MDFLEMLWASLNQELPATLLAVGVGIPIALYVDRRITTSRIRKEKTDLVRLLRWNLEHNLSLLYQIKKNIVEKSIPLYPLDLTTWQTHSTRITSIDKVELIQSINESYYELEHLNRKVNAYFDFLLSVIVTNGLRKRMELLSEAILTHVDNLIPRVKETLEQINKG